jgi:drug/metabolite transporter (DMT)-like permease
MTTTRNRALIALTVAGLLWGTSVPLSKAALTGFGPAWLTVIRFAIAGALLMVLLRPQIRGAVRPSVMLWGALGYGGCIAVQNLGLARTSVTHAALLIGAVPVIVAGLAVLFEGAKVNLATWAGFGLSLAGITVVAGAGGGDASLAGDGLVLLSVLIGSAFTVIQVRLLAGQDVIAVSAAQFLASAVVIAPIAVVTEGLPSPGDWSRSALLAAAALATIGTVLPYTLFAYGQTGVPAQIAGAFLNLETLVAALLGATLFGEPKSLGQGVGALALLGGIFLSTWHGVEPAPESELVPEWDGMSEREQLSGLKRGSELKRVSELAAVSELERVPALDNVLEREGAPHFHARADLPQAA